MKQIEFWADQPEVTAGFSLKEHTKDEVREILAKRGLLVVRPVQIHQDKVCCITEEQKTTCIREGQTELVLENTDAVITGCSAVALTTVHADCIPVFLYDTKTGAMGLAHAGWKGTWLGIGGKTACAMKEELGASFEHMRAVIGPGIGICCFEVGEEVYETFAESYSYIGEYAQRMEKGRYYIDLKGLNQRQLAELGIKDIEVSPLCTVCEKEGFFSYRREGKLAGRMVAFCYR